MSQPARKTPYASVSLQQTVRSEVQRVGLDLSAQVGRRLTASDVVRAALTVARAHSAEFLNALMTSADDQTGDTE